MKPGDRVVIVAPRPGFERLRGCRASVLRDDREPPSSESFGVETLSLWVDAVPELSAEELPYLRPHDVDRINRGCVYDARPGELRLLNLIESIGEIE